MLRIALICGGPSAERGISLNSARSVLDHLAGPNIQIIPLYVDCEKEFHLISSSHLYSNTPADFDYKLDSLAQKLPKGKLGAFFKEIDLTFPVVHGAYGEGGELQKILEEYQIPYIGSDAKSCQTMFCKYQASEILKKNGFYTFPSICLEMGQSHQLKKIEEFFEAHALTRAIVKPTQSGSSIGVFSVRTPQEAFEACHHIFEQGIDKKVLLEIFCEGQEFTVLVLENRQGQPVALIPTEIEMDYAQNQIFDYRRKYLPTNQTTYHTPPRFTSLQVDQIRLQAQEIFKLFHMRDYVRMDGWILKDGQICFTDINPVSGLEQNSFLFRQTSLLGLTHQQTLAYLLKNACARANVAYPNEKNLQALTRFPVYILFGNNNAERQVSLLSGTNVWLKLLQSEKLYPIPCLYDLQKAIWQLPYSFALNHTVEEIQHHCQISQDILFNFGKLIESICHDLELSHKEPTLPLKLQLEDFLVKAKTENAFVFLALHGGEGENGTFQKKLEQFQIPFNGSNSRTSALCMDKYHTASIIHQMNDPDIVALPKVRIDLFKLPWENGQAYQKLWTELCQYLACHRLIVKPRTDGCSAGIILLERADDLALYAKFIQTQETFIPANTFSNQKDVIEMPSSTCEHLIEPYVQTDRIILRGKLIQHVPLQGWIELTVGVMESEGNYRSLNPSIAIADGAVLSLEEKFQGGTGINLTPPPEEIISNHAKEKIRKGVSKVAQALGIQNYARLDIFFNRLTEKIIVIEANSLPALTPSTVLYHQALMENPPLTPKAFIEKIIESKLIGLGV